MFFQKSLISFLVIASLLSCVQQATVVSIPKTNNSDDEKLIKVDPPVYPNLQINTGVQGLVITQFDVNEDGRVENTKVVEDKPEGVFGEGATASVRSSGYKPKYNHGV